MSGVDNQLPVHPARPHHRYTEDGRRMREVLSYSRRGGRFTPTQQESWDAHHHEWVVPDEAVDDERLPVGRRLRSRGADHRGDRLRRRGGDGGAGGGPTGVRRRGAGGLAARGRAHAGPARRGGREQRAAALGRRDVVPRAPLRPRRRGRAVDVLPRPVAQEEAPQAAPGHALVRARWPPRGSRWAAGGGWPPTGRRTPSRCSRCWTPSRCSRAAWWSGGPTVR